MEGTISFPHLYCFDLLILLYGPFCKVSPEASRTWVEPAYHSSLSHSRVDHNIIYVRGPPDCVPPYCLVSFTRAWFASKRKLFMYHTSRDCSLILTFFPYRALTLSCETLMLVIFCPFISKFSCLDKLAWNRKLRWGTSSLQGTMRQHSLILKPILRNTCFELMTFGSTVYFSISSHYREGRSLFMLCPLNFHPRCSYRKKRGDDKQAAPKNLPCLYLTY